MPYINQPPSMQSIFNDLNNRITKLENAQRFTAPNVDFGTSTPANPRVGDIFFDTDALVLMFWDGSNWVEIATV
jgi:hypothetical protein